MKTNKKEPLFSPLVFNVFKPARMTSYDVIRHFKRNLPPGYGKIGHFGTLDPFASGVLMIGICGASRLNELIHEFLPKTYLAVGKLGVETPTGDFSSEILQTDDSIYLKKEISTFTCEFIQTKLKERFLGEYWQAPHKYSAAKFLGKNLHEWAREGIEVKKDAVKRRVYKIEVIKFVFPYLSIRVQVSSGTYVRTLFTEMCNYLGTLGTLVSLVREEIGHIHHKESLHKKDWAINGNPLIIKKANNVQDVLPFSILRLNQEQSISFKNGAFLNPESLEVVNLTELSNKYFWIMGQNQEILGLGEKNPPYELRPKINFHSLSEINLKNQF